jgi:undecaprenyl-diphosphatase
LIVVAFIKDRKAWILLILAALVILLTDTISAQVIKPLVGRLRPCNDPGFKDSVRLLVHCGSGFSFLSSHATNHFGLAILFIQYFRKWFSSKWLTIVFLLWAVSIAFSQVYVGVHYPFDVICGALLGMGLAYLVWHVYLRISTQYFKHQ